MAKKSMIAREAKRTQLVAKYAAQRAELKQSHQAVRRASDDEKWDAQI